MIAISSELLISKNVLYTFGEYPAKLENIKNFQLSLGVFGDMYTVTTSTFCPFTRHSAAQTSPYDSEATNLNEALSGFVYSASRENDPEIFPSICLRSIRARVLGK
jgi:hypothetical protein